MTWISLLRYVCVLLAASSLQAESLDSILARMDQSAPTFKGARAKVTMVTFTKLLNDKSTQSGKMEMQRQKSGETRAILDLEGSGDGQEGQVIAFLGKKILIYYPKANTYQTYQVGDKSKEINQFLLLGFGSSGKELKQSYNVTEKGVEKVAGVDATKLLLTPNDPTVSQTVARIEMWLPINGVSPIKQTFYQPSGNSRETTYSSIEINPNFPKTLDYKLPPGATK